MATVARAGINPWYVLLGNSKYECIYMALSGRLYAAPHS